MRLRPAETDFLYQLSAYQLQWEEQRHLCVLVSNTVSMSFQSYVAP